MPGRLLAISDLHVGYPENRAYAEALAPGNPADWLIVAGDVGESFTDVGFTLASLTRRFARVIWAPGNHELWTMPSDPVALRGVARYEALVAACRRFGVLTPEDEFPVWDGPGGPVTVAPVFTLYDYSFTAGDPAPAGPADAGAAAGTDPAGTDQAGGGQTSGEQAGGWRSSQDGLDEAAHRTALAAAGAAGVRATDEGRLHSDPYPSVAAWCRDRVAQTERRLAAVDGPLVLAGHWPLLPAPLDAMRYPAYAPWCGSTLTAGWHSRFPVRAVVYGHLHIPGIAWHDGVRFEEVSVGYPVQWQHRGGTPPPPRVILGD